MGIGSWGGGIILGLVAVLWLVYLIPSWHKRQEYLATERNAVRLQQTLRILAQTAELPEEIRVEANAKSVASAQKVLRSEQAKREAIRRAHEAARQRAITRELAATAPVLRAADAEPALAARRLRRTRLVATLVLLAGIVSFVLGLTVFPGALLALAAGAVAVVGSVVVLTQLAAVSRARARRAHTAPLVAATTAPVAQEFQDFAPRATIAGGEAGAQDPAARVSDAGRQWTPVAMPRPLYLRRGSARALARSSAFAGAPTSAGDAEALRAAAGARAAELRASQEEAQREALREVARAEAALESQRARAEAPAEASAETLAEVPGRRVLTPIVAAVTPIASAVPEAGSAPTSGVSTQRRDPSSPFARMGYLDEGETQELRLDEVLQRRRAV